MLTKYLILANFMCYFVIAQSTGSWSFKKREYMFNDNFQGDFYAADNFCTNSGMMLLTLDNEEENKSLLDALKNTPIQGPYWTSANKLQDGDQWIWLTTGQPILTFHWATGEPDNEKNNENCIQTKINRYSEGWWADVSCEIRGAVICQRDRSDYRKN